MSVGGDSIRGPWHRSPDALEDGRVPDGPSTYDHLCFVARVRDGMVEVRDLVPRGRSCHTALSRATALSQDLNRSLLPAGKW